MIKISTPGALISKITSFIGGMVSNISPSNLKPYMTPGCMNILPDEDIGAIESRAGSVLMGHIPTAAAVKFMYTFNKSDGTSEILVSDGATLWTTTDFANFTSKKTGLSSNAQLYAVTVRNKVWLTNGTDSVMTYDSTGTLTVLDGTGGTPNVPKGKYIIFCQERPWLASTTDNPSIVSFPSLSDVTGNPIAPDSATAWPAANALYADQNDGDNIFGIVSFHGMPFVFKSNSFGVITGSDEYSYGYQRVITNVGTRFHSCIVERDGVLEFVGPDGFYETQGSPETTIRVSDLVKDEFDKLSQPATNVKNKLWSIAADWLSGIFTRTKIGDTILSSIDSIIMSDTLTLINSFSNNYTGWTIESGNWVIIIKPALAGLNGSISYPSTLKTGTWKINVSMTQVVTQNWPALHSFNFDFMVDGNGNKYSVYGYYQHWYTMIGPFPIYHLVSKICLTKTVNNVLTTLYSSDLDIRTNHEYKVIRSYNGEIKLYVDNVLMTTKTDIDVTSSIKVKLGESTQYSVLAYFENYYASNMINDVDGNYWDSADTNIGNGTDITNWGVLEADLDSGVTLKIKGATTQGGLTDATWHDILPGANIAETKTTPWIKIRANLVAPDVYSIPILRSININWNLGGTTSQRMVAINYKNRNLLSSSQYGCSYNNIIWVKTKRTFKPPDMPAVFVPFNWKVVSFCIFNDNLYAGVSYCDGTNEGGIIRLFIGDRDQYYTGAFAVTNIAINSYIETRNENFELLMNKKKLMEVAVDYLPKGVGNITLQGSRDDNAYSTFGMLDNTGLNRTARIYAVRGILGKNFRLKMSVNTIGYAMKIYSVDMIAIPIKIRE